MTQQLDQFNARVKRINNPRNNSYKDPETGMVIPKRVSRQLIRTNNRIRPQKAGMMGMLMSLILGAMCLIGARYVRFEVAGISELDSDPSSILAMDAGLALMAAFVIGGVIKHKSLRHMAAQLAGVAVLAVGMHNIVWMVPEQVAQVFSSDYIGQVQQLTVPMSIYVNGETVYQL